MPRIGLVFNVRRRYGDAALPLFRSFIDRSIFEKICESLFRLPLGYSSCKGSLQPDLERGSWPSDVKGRTLP